MGLIISPTAEKRLEEVISHMRLLDEYLRSIDITVYQHFELGLFRVLEKLRRYHIDYSEHVPDDKGAVSMLPDGPWPGTEFHLVWATRDRGPYKDGLLHWSGPNLSIKPAQAFEKGNAVTWEWSTHT